MCVGLTILTLFATCLWPIGYRHDKYTSKRTACLSNLKQLTRASIMYASDNNEVFPTNFTFDGQVHMRKYMATIKAYLGNENQYTKYIFHCPFDTTNWKPGDQLETKSTVPVEMTYVHCNVIKNVIPDFALGKRILKASSVQDPAKVSYLRDPIRGTQEGIPQSLHGPKEGFNISYLDGHAKRKKENYTADL